MEQTVLSLDPALRKKAANYNDQYHRQLNNTCEQVDFQPDTTLRFFINDQAESYETHWHQAMEMIMPLENSYEVLVGQEHFTLQPGDILFIPSGELHQLTAPASGLRLIYMFDPDTISGIRGFSYLAAFLSHAVLITEQTCPEIYRREADLMLRLSSEYFNGGPLRDLTCYASLLNFFAIYGEYRMALEDMNQSVKRASKKQEQLHDKLTDVFDYMDQHYSEAISLETVAAVAGFSKFHFSRLFKEGCGYNFYDYLCLLRIKAAESLLITPNLSITEVALQSGFSSLSTFNRNFRKFKGCSPSEYRALCSPSEE